MLVVGKRKYEFSGGRGLWWGFLGCSSDEVSVSDLDFMEPFSASFLERQIALGFKKSASSSSWGGHYLSDMFWGEYRTSEVKKCCRTMTCLTSSCSSVS